MIRALSILILASACQVLCSPLTPMAYGSDDKERMGTVSGELKSRTEAKNGKSVTLEILASGEEKPRRYFVAYNPKDPTAEKPFKELLAKVNAAKIGDRVRIAWVNAPKGSEGGFFVMDFEVLMKADAKSKIDKKQ